MRFVVLTQYFQPEIGAPQVRLASMIRELRRLGHEVEVVTALPNYPQGKIFAEYRRRPFCRESWEGVPVHRVWLYASMGAGLKRMINYGSFTGLSLFGLARCKRPDYVFVESPPLFLSVPGYIASRLWRAPMIFNVADLWPDSVRELGLMKEGAALRFADRLERWTYRKSAFVNAVTDGIRKTLIEKKKVPASKVLYLPNGVDTRLFRPQAPDRELARELGLAGRRVILYAGTLGFAQGLEVALDAMEILKAELPEAAMVFIGSGSEKGRLVELARSKSLSNVVFLDPNTLEYVARLYSIAFAGFASLKALPLFEGARPSKLMPVLGSGKPAIYSGAGEGARLVEGVGAGLAVPPEDSGALAEAIRTLMADPARAEAMGCRGREYAEDHLSWSALIKDWVGQLEEAAG